MSPKCTFCAPTAKRRRQRRQRQVVRRHQADGAALDETLHDGGRPDAAVVRVRARQQLVEQEQHRQRPGRLVDDRPEPRDLGEEPRFARLQRVLHAQRRADRQRRERQAPRAHRRAGLGEHRCDADRPEQRALARHVRSRDDQHARGGVQPHVVRHTARGAISGCARPSPSKSGPRSTIAGNGSAGCSYAYDESEVSASNSPTPATH